MNLQIARLATVKSAERTLASGVMEHGGDSQYGKIIYVIDVPLPLSIGEPVEHAIVSTIQEEYFNVDRKSPLYQFEDCIKQVNLSLSELAEGGKTDWIGHVHACIALWAGDELFVTHAGKVLGLVARGGSLVSFIDASLSDRRVMVHKTFANLTSGQLHNGDRLIIGNGEILRHFSPQFLSQTIVLSPTDCIRDMQAAARRLNLRYITAIVGQVGEGEDDENLPTSILLSANSDSSATQLENNLQNQAVNPLRQFNNNVIKIIDILIANSKKLLPTKPEIKYDDVDSHSNENMTDRPDGTTIAPPVLERPSLQKVGHTIDRVRRIIVKYLRQIATKIRHIPPRVLLIIGLACVILVVASSLTQNKIRNVNKPSKSQLAELIDQTNTKLDKAENEATQKPDVARDELILAQTLIDQVRVGGDEAEAQKLQARYTKLIEVLNNVVVLKSVSITTIDSKTSHVANIGQYLFSIRAGSTELFRQTLGKDAPAEPIFNINKGEISYMSLIDDDRRLILSSSKNQIWRIDIDNQTNATELLPPSGEEWPKAISIVTYQDNLYILEAESGTIWKYTSRDKINFATKTPYLASQTLNNPKFTAIASDGFMYTLTVGGEVGKLLKGAPQSFGPFNIPKPGDTFQNAARMFTSANSSSIIIQDAHRLIEVTKDGQYVRQYVLNDATINTSFVSPKSKRAWFVVGDKLIETGL